MAIIKSQKDRKEIWAIVFLCFFAFVALSLISYQPTDPSLNSVATSSEVKNLTGLVGSYTADALFQVFGLSAYWLLGIILFFAYLCFFPYRVEKKFIKLFGFVMLMIFSCALFSLVFDMITLKDQRLLAGGLVGHIFTSWMLPYFNRTGTYIVVIGGLLINLILALEFSYLGFFSFLFQGLPAFFRELTFKKLLGLLFSPFSKLKKTPQTKIVTYQNQPLAEVEPPVGVEPSEIEYEEGEPEDAETMAEENVPEENVEEVYYETEPEDLPPLPPEDVPPAQGAQAIEYMEDDPASELEESIEAQSIHEDPVIVEPSAQARVKKKKNSRLNFDYVRPRGNFKLPTLNLLADSEIHEEIEIDRETLLQNSKILEQKLKDFNVEGRVVEVRPGPVITVYEFEPAAGVKVSRIVNLADDLSLALSALSVRIVAPIPGKSVVGIELPNDNRQLVKLKEILLNNEFKSLKYRLPLALGKSISGEPLIADLARMPHLLVAGATGSGKSVFINSLICSFLFRYTPDQLRFLMIDPKMLELSMYDKIPHLLLPVVTDPKKAAQALKWAVLEMEKRYTIMSRLSVRNIDSYNKKIEDTPKEELEALFAQEIENDEMDPFELPDQLPYVVIVIDELADLMMVASKEVELSIARLTQMARAAGIHLLVATQRPSVDVLTGLIKANFPARISFQTSTKVDSRTILDSMGAEKLLGGGDMLFLKPGISRLIRIHGAYVSDQEIKDIVSYLREQGEPEYNEEILSSKKEEGDVEFQEEDDGLYEEAVNLVSKMKYASISMIQRRLRIGYNRAARMIEQMEAEGLVGPADGAKPREVLIHNPD